MPGKVAIKVPLNWKALVERDTDFLRPLLQRVVQEVLEAELEQFHRRRLEEAYPYLILDARYEKVREDGVIRTKAVQVAIGINEDGRRCVLAVEMAQRESHTS